MKKNLMIMGLVAMAVLIVMAALSSYDSPALADEDGMGNGTLDLEGEIHVTGQARISVAPDTAVISLGVEASDTSSVARAHSRASTAMNAILASLADSGVDTTTDVQTTHFSISPKYEWKDDGRVMVGYTAIQSISVKVRDLDNVGMVIDQAVEAGGNATRFHGLNFVAQDNPDLMAELRENAYNDAHDKAEHLAELAGLELAGAFFISTSVGYVPEPYYAEAALARSDTSISPGQVDMSMSIQVRFRTIGADISATPVPEN